MRGTKPYPPYVPLERLTPEEWEALCDGCGKCCLHRLEDEDTGEIHYTNVVCRYLALDDCRCSDYPNRSTNVPECLSVTLELLEDPWWLPSTCSYRLLVEGRPLPEWHPLITGDPDSVFRAGIAVCGRVVHETEVEDLMHHLVEWVE